MYLVARGITKKSGEVISYYNLDFLFYFFFQKNERINT